MRGTRPRLAAGPDGDMNGMFVFTKRSGERGRMRFMWWPLLISIALSVVLTIVLNALI